MKNENSYKSILAITLLVYISIIIIMNILITDKVFSDSENRRLEQAPKLIASHLLDGRFTKNYEKYVSDQFPLRDFWIGIKSTSEKALGKKENNGVYLAKDGYLIDKFEEPGESELKSKVEEVNKLVDTIPKVDKYFLLVPNAVKVLEDKLPAHGPSGDQYRSMEEIKDSLGTSINFVDIYDKLYSHKDEYIYYKTDHHWTSRGAYLAYEELMEDMGIVPHKEDYFNIEKVTDDFYGSLYSKSGFRNIDPDSIVLYRPKKAEKYKVEYLEEERVSDSIYNMEGLDEKDKYTVFLGGNHPLIKISTEINNDKKLLILKDSYANSMIPFLIGHFNEIYIVDPRYYKDDIDVLVEDNGINKLLFLYNVKTFLE